MAAAISAVGGTSPTSDANSDIAFEEPFVVEFTIRGVAPFLFHRYSNEAVAEKKKAAKNSAAKKTDNVESYVYRDEHNDLAIPGRYVHSSMQNAAKFRQDPRSPRKSAFDLYKAAIAPLTPLASLGQSEWDYLDEQRVLVQRNAVTRVRPALLEGWTVAFSFQVGLPEYVRSEDFLDVLTLAGKVIGIGDFRPTYGRFQVVSFSTM